MDANQLKAQSDVVVILSQKVGDLIGGLCGLTFELSRHQRWDARARLAKMYRVPSSGPAWPAVGARLERGVRLHCCAPKDWPAYQQRAMVLEAEATSARDAATHAVPLPLTALSEATAALGGSGPKEG